MCVVLFVARETVTPNWLINPLRVTVGTLHLAMQSDQRPIGVLIVVEPARLPEAAPVAPKAVVAERALVKLVGMARRPALARHLPDVVRMRRGLWVTLDAGDVYVAAVERELRARPMKPSRRA